MTKVSIVLCITTVSRVEDIKRASANQVGGDNIGARYDPRQISANFNITHLWFHNSSSRSSMFAFPMHQTDTEMLTSYADNFVENANIATNYFVQQVAVSCAITDSKSIHAKAVSTSPTL